MLQKQILFKVKGAAVRMTEIQLTNKLGLDFATDNLENVGDDVFVSKNPHVIHSREFLVEDGLFLLFLPA